MPLDKFVFNTEAHPLRISSIPKANTWWQQHMEPWVHPQPQEYNITRHFGMVWKEDSSTGWGSRWRWGSSSSSSEVSSDGGGSGSSGGGGSKRESHTQPRHVRWISSGN